MVNNITMKPMENNRTVVEYLMDEILKDRLIKANSLLDWYNIIEKAREMYIKELNNIDYSNVTRFEVINHAVNNDKIGRLLVKYKEKEDFNNLEIAIQDDGKTMKVFLT